MKRSKIILFALGLIIGIAVTLVITVNSIGLPEEASATNMRFFDSKNTGSMGNGDALVELTPKIDNSKLIVHFLINTHSVKLGRFNLKEITTLEYGNTVRKPIKASRIGGHHSSGTIVFDAEEDMSSFTIKVRGIPRVNERVYEWSVG
jgi:hypothetical protein